MWWRGLQLRIGDEFGLDELDVPSARLDRAGSGRKDVLHPLHVRPIGEEEEVIVASLENVDRRSVGTSALAPSVRQDAEARKPPCNGARDRVDVALHDVPKAPHAGPTMRRGVALAHRATITTRSP